MEKKVRNIAIVSLSRGTIGEQFVAHEIKIGLDRLKEYGINVKFMPNALKGIEYVEKHPELRASDLLDALTDNNIDMILCAVGGDDTYRTMPYFFNDERIKNIDKKKIFLGFSDSTINHLMLQSLGMKTFYGQAFLPDICEISNQMLEYSKKYFEELIETGKISSIISSPIWYKARESYSIDDVGTDMPSFHNDGFELLQGNAVFSGKIYGGCIDTLYDIFNNERYSDTVEVCSKYKIFPIAEEWKDRILLIETSEEMAAPDKYRKMLTELKKAGVFENVNGILAGKPINEVYADDYKKILCEVVENKSLPIIFNFNAGHCTPRAIVPMGVEALVDCNKQIVIFE